jgi:UDP-2,3-diacylglucosamine hydrolase
VGVKTIEAMRQAGATCLALDAGRCLLLDGNAIAAAADSAGITIVVD